MIVEHQTPFQDINDDTEVNIDILKIKVRATRNLLLTLVDKVNPIRYATLTDEQRTELIAYRQALLDVPTQSGFPNNVIWPTNPTWLL
jgi:hypothetical protein